MSPRVRSGVDFHSFHGFDDQFVQAFGALRYVVDELIYHAWLPEFPDVVQNSGYRFFSWESGETERDLVRVVNHQLPRVAYPPDDFGPVVRYQQ